MTIDTKKLRDRHDYCMRSLNEDFDVLCKCADTIDAQAEEIARLREALTAIEQWEVPMVESRGESVPMSVVYGSNGVRDYFRGVARTALSGESND